MKDNNLKSNKIKSNNKDYDLKKILLKEKKIDYSFLEKIKFLTLEDIIFLKLQSAAESLKGKV